MRQVVTPASSMSAEKFRARLIAAHADARELRDPDAVSSPFQWFAGRTRNSVSNVSRWCSEESREHKRIPFYALGHLELLEQVNEMRRVQLETDANPVAALRQAAKEAEAAAADLRAQIDMVQMLDDGTPITAARKRVTEVPASDASGDRAARFGRYR